MRMIDFWSFFASCIHISVIMRICEILPGDPSIELEDNTESESIITIFAVERSIVLNIESNSESVRSDIFS